MKSVLFGQKPTSRQLYLDARTKLILCLLTSFIMFSCNYTGVMRFVLPVLSALPFFSFLILKKYRTATGYILAYGICLFLPVVLRQYDAPFLNIMSAAIASIFTQMLPGLSMFNVLLSSTSVSEFIAAMDGFHISKKFSVPVSVMFRFFPTIREEYQFIRDALRLRGIGTLAHPSEMLEYRMVPLLTELVQVGNELSASAMTRGLDAPNKRTNVCRSGFHAQDIIAFVFCAVVIMLFIISKVLGCNMIEIKNVDFFYETAESESSLKNVSVTVPKGQVVLLCGESGSGKTTFGRLINGLIPCYYDGKMDGQVFVNKISTAGIQLHELAETVGSVFQNPKSQFYTLLTDTEIVFACENIGMERSEIFSRFEKTVQDFHMEKLLGKNVSQLSGGEKQKIACACVSMLEPPIFILDEPTSNLDIGAIRELKKIIRKWKDSGKTILIAEHRLWWTKDLIDRVLIFREGEIAEDINAAEFWSRSPEEFRSRGLRSFSGFAPIKAGVTLTDAHYTISEFQYANGKNFSIHVPKLEIPKGAVVAVLGNNGAGKSTFAKCLCGLTKCKVQIYDGNRTYRGRELRKLSFMVFQDVNHQLFSESALEDVTLGLSLSKEEKTAVAEDALRRMNLADCKDTHPMALSGGQKQRLAITGALAAKKELILYDEPTSGLDYRNMERVAQNINALAEAGKTQLVITHDPELVEKCCDYYLFFENGEIIEYGTWSERTINRIQDYFDIGTFGHV